MNSLISIRINPKTKKAAQKTLRNLGLDLSSGVKLFLEQVVSTESIPFVPATPTGHKLRRAAIYRKETAETLRSGKGYKTAAEMHADILKESSR